LKGARHLLRFSRETFTLSSPLLANGVVDGAQVNFTVARPAQNALLSFAATAGQYENLAASANVGAHSEVKLLSPTGATLTTTRQIIEIDFPLQRLTETGTYQTLIDPDAGATGDYAWTLSTPVTATVEIEGPTVTLTPTRFGQDALFQYTGIVFLPISNSLSGSSVYSADVTLRTPYGVEIAKVLTPTSNVGIAAGGVGQFDLAVSPRRLASGTYSLTLSYPFSLIPDGKAKTITVPGNTTAGIYMIGFKDQYLSLATDKSSGVATNQVINKADGEGWNSTWPIGTGWEIDIPRLPETNAYYVAYQNSTAITGVFTLTLTSARTLTVPVDGPSASTVITRPAQDLRILFTATAGQAIGLGFEFQRDYENSYVRIYGGPASSLLHQQLVYGFEIQDVTADVFTTTGVYTAMLNTNSPYGASSDYMTGTHTVTLSSLVQQAATIGGPTVVLPLGRIGQDGRVLFTGLAGQRVIVNITDGTPAQTTRSNLTVVAPDGSELYYNDNVYAPSNAEMVLPFDGPYTATVDTQDLTGVFSVTLSTPVLGNLSLDGASLPMTTTRLGEYARVTFQGAAGQMPGLGITGANLNQLNLSLLNPSGQSLSGVVLDTINAQGELPTLPADGEYILRVVPDAAVTASAFTLTLSHPARVEARVDGLTNTVDASRQGQNAEIVFEGLPGQSIRLNLNGPNTTSMAARLYRPNGTQLGNTMYVC
jgi:hypothetical protein